METIESSLPQICSSTPAIFSNGSFLCFPISQGANFEGSIHTQFDAIACVPQGDPSILVRTLVAFGSSPHSSKSSRMTCFSFVGNHLMVGFADGNVAFVDISLPGDFASRAKWFLPGRICACSMYIVQEHCEESTPKSSTPVCECRPVSAIKVNKDILFAGLLDSGGTIKNHSLDRLRPIHSTMATYHSEGTDKAPDSNALLWGDIWMWDLSSRQTIGWFRGHKSAVTDLLVLHHNKLLISVDENNFLRVWSTLSSSTVSKAKVPSVPLECSHRDEFILNSSLVAKKTFFTTKSNLQVGSNHIVFVSNSVAISIWDASKLGSIQLCRVIFCFPDVENLPRDVALTQVSQIHYLLFTLYFQL